VAEPTNEEMRNHTHPRVARPLHCEPGVTGDLLHGVPRARPGVRTTDLLACPAPPTAPDAAAPPMLGAYPVVGLVQAGGMGGVYVGRHVLTGERVALKVHNPRMSAQPDLVNRLFGELDVSRRVGHDGLVTIRDRAVAADGTPYLVMELIDGENLGDLAERGRIEIGAIAAIGAQVSDALAAMHERRIVHCDLKPDNVLVLYRHGLAGWPTIKVVDFGVARFLDRHVDPTVAGTPVYMPPEQWSGDVEPRSDVYALGCTLYELLTGRTPFDGSLVELLTAHTEQRPESPSVRRPGVPLALEHLVLRMLAKEPGLRPRMADVSRQLTDLAFALPPGARSVEPIALAG
jgi:serine/threonine-protein kinase